MCWPSSAAGLEGKPAPKLFNGGREEFASGLVCTKQVGAAQRAIFRRATRTIHCAEGPVHSSATSRSAPSLEQFRIEMIRTIQHRHC